MKIDATNKYDVIDIVSNISSQVTDNKGNDANESLFSVILENTLKLKDAHGFAGKSGNKWQIFTAFIDF